MAAPPCKMIMPSLLRNFLPQFPWQSGRDFCLPSHGYNGQLVHRACIGVYRPIATAILLPFVIYAALSSGPRQQSYGPDRLNPSVAYISILFPRRGHLLHLAVGIDIAARRVLELPRAGFARDREVIPPLVPRVTLRSNAAPPPPRRCDRRGRSLISRLMSFLIALLLPAALFLSVDPRSPAHAVSRVIFCFHY